MTREQEKAWVAAARSGSARALARLIDAVANRKTTARTATDLELYAFKMQRGLRVWDAYDIIALMQEIIWRMVMRPEGRLGYDPERAPLAHLAWTALRNSVYNQIRDERRLKRGGGQVELPLQWLQEDHHPTTSGDPTIQADIDRVRDSLRGPARMALVMLMAGYRASEIAEIMTTPNNRWTSKRVQSLIRNEIRPAMEPIRQELQRR